MYDAQREQTREKFLDWADGASGGTFEQPVFLVREHCRCSASS